MDVDLALEVLAGDDAHDAPGVVLHERLGRALEVIVHALALAEAEHGVGGVLHLEHVMVERGVLRRHVHRHLAQAPLHAAVGHPVDARATRLGNAVDEVRVGRVVVLVHGPVGELARVEGVFGEGEALRLLQLRSAQNGAHAGRLCVAAVQAHGLDADDVRAQLGRARRGVQPAAARAHDADLAFVVPLRRHGARRNGRGVVRGERGRVVLAVRAVGAGSVALAAVGNGDVLRAVGRPVADDAGLHGIRRCRSRGRQCRPAHERRRTRQERATGEPAVTISTGARSRPSVISTGARSAERRDPAPTRVVALPVRVLLHVHPLPRPAPARGRPRRPGGCRRS